MLAKNECECVSKAKEYAIFVVVTTDVLGGVVGFTTDVGSLYICVIIIFSSLFQRFCPTLFQPNIYH